MSHRAAAKLPHLYLSRKLHGICESPVLSEFLCSMLRHDLFSCVLSQVVALIVVLLNKLPWIFFLNFFHFISWRLNILRLQYHQNIFLTQCALKLILRTLRNYLFRFYAFWIKKYLLAHASKLFDACAECWMHPRQKCI